MWPKKLIRKKQKKKKTLICSLTPMPTLSRLRHLSTNFLLVPATPTSYPNMHPPMAATRQVMVTNPVVFPWYCSALSFAIFFCVLLLLRTTYYLAYIK